MEQSKESQPGATSFRELMEAYHRADGNPAEQWQILRRAADVALASGNLGQQLQVNAAINSFEQRYGRR